MRVTMHNGRAGKHGAYSARHNDRDIKDHDKHIDPEKTPGNWVWHCKQDTFPLMTLNEMERSVYEEHFMDALIDRNERAVKARHPERIIDMDGYRESRQTCPEETIMQIGSVEDGHVDTEALKEICIKQRDWEQKTFPQCKILSMALHVDEQGAPHVHKRQVWIAHDKKGREIVGQAKALEEMGIKRPDQKFAPGTRNNAKQTYTTRCREHFIGLIQDYMHTHEMHGKTLELTPRDPSQSGRDLLEWQVQQEQEKLAKLWEKEVHVCHLTDELEIDMRGLEHQKAQKKAENAKLDESIAAKEKALTEVSETLQDKLSKEAELKDIDQRLKSHLETLEKAARIKAPSALEKAIFKRDTVVYDRETVEGLQSIAETVKKTLTDIDKRSRDLDKREVELNSKANEIEPLYAEAKREKDTQKAIREGLEDYIDQEADKKIDRRLEALIEREFASDKGGRASRMEKFLRGYKNGDKSLLEIFETQEAKLKNRLTHSLSR